MRICYSGGGVHSFSTVTTMVMLVVILLLSKTAALPSPMFTRGSSSSSSSSTSTNNYILSASTEASSYPAGSIPPPLKPIDFEDPDLNVLVGDMAASEEREMLANEQELLDAILRRDLKSIASIVECPICLDVMTSRTMVTRRDLYSGETNKR